MTNDEFIRLKTPLRPARGIFLTAHDLNESSRKLRLIGQGSARVTKIVELPDDAATPVSARIRNRLRKSRQSFFANENIASAIKPGEMDELLEEVAAKMKGVLESLVIDVENDHNTQDLARRVAKMYLTEVFSGRYAAPPPVTEFPNASGLNELMIVGPVAVRSACSHHLCPIMGRIWIGVMPNQNSNLIGLSKYARLTDWIMSRPQIPGRSHFATGRAADGSGQARRPRGGHGSRSLLHAMARRQGFRGENDQ